MCVTPEEVPAPLVLDQNMAAVMASVFFRQVAWLVDLASAFTAVSEQIHLGHAALHVLCVP